MKGRFLIGMIVVVGLTISLAVTGCSTSAKDEPTKFEGTWTKSSTSSSGPTTYTFTNRKWTSSTGGSGGASGGDFSFNNQEILFQTAYDGYWKTYVLDWELSKVNDIMIRRDTLTIGGVKYTK